MARTDGGTLLAETLVGLGVEDIFTLHGGHLDGAYQALVRRDVRLVDTRHEQAAGIAAIGYGRVTGKTGVCMVTAGGGVTNVVTAIASAYADCIPSVFIGGAPPLHDFDALPVNAGYDQMSLMAGITKWAHRIALVEQIPYVVGKAFHLAASGRPGPIYLDIPSDVLFGLADDQSVTRYRAGCDVAAPAPSPNSVRKVIELLRGAERPVLLAGGGVVGSEASDLLKQFADLTGIPVLTNAKARGVLPTDHPLYGRGFASLAAAANRGAGSADVVVMLGARQGIYTGGIRKSFIADDATLIQVDVSSDEFSRIRRPDLGIVADCKEMLAALLPAAGNGPWEVRDQWIAALKGAVAAPPLPVSGRPKPGHLAAAIAAIAPRDTIFVLDGGETPAWLDAVADSFSSRKWLGHGYIGIMGEGLPLAVGAKVGQPDATVVCFAGDGAIGFNFAEFDTMVRHGLPVIVIVNNDRQWAMSANGQDMLFGPGHRVVSELAATRYDLAAAGFGAHAELVEDIGEFAEAYRRAVESGLPACINVMTERDVGAITTRLMGLAAEGPVSPDGKARVPYADILEV
ncbi:thiamine pyrophosphate-binding protein [Mesorhizobium sp. CAU 1741]|uniref:thiamine pyrophosphate-binding protein n=1 Tax=Mesorhizobium sp. CAU 1741 TaxID=3140366 RepID=UPI00325B635C